MVTSKVVFSIMPSRFDTNMVLFPVNIALMIWYFFVFFSFKFVYKPYSGLIPTCNKCFNQSLTWSRKREKPKKPRETPNLCPQPLSLYRSELFPSRPLVILLLYDPATWPTDHSKNEIKWTSEIYSRKHRWYRKLIRKWA